VVAGDFTTLRGEPRSNIGRLNPDGTVDAQFNPGADGVVRAMAEQPDGQIVVAGEFGTLGGQPRGRIGRLDANGTVDGAFNPGAVCFVESLAIQRDGKILVGGAICALAGQPKMFLARLNGNGSIDTGFQGRLGEVAESLAVQPDGRILVGGDYMHVNSEVRLFLARLEESGTTDYGFNGPVTGHIHSVAMQANGKILVGGTVGDGIGGLSGGGRLNTDGSLDTGFNPGASNDIYSVAVQADGKILVGGWFTTLGGQTRNYLGRLTNPDPATQSLCYEGSTITWLRGGSSPEVSRTTFEASNDGTNWTSLGEGTRISGGWQLTEATMTSQATLRARGHVVGGCYNASSWFVESSLTASRPTRLNLGRDGSELVLSLEGGQGSHQLQHTSNLTDSNSWAILGEASQTNSIRLPIGPGNRFFRIQPQ
jgi:uncharacterized delta-60 repeat protein